MFTERVARLRIQCRSSASFSLLKLIQAENHRLSHLIGTAVMMDRKRNLATGLLILVAVLSVDLVRASPRGHALEFVDIYPPRQFGPEVVRIVDDRIGSYWFLTNLHDQRSCLRFDGSILRIVPELSGAIDIVADNDNHLWVLTRSNRLHVYDLEVEQIAASHEFGSKGFPVVSPGPMLCDRQGATWVADSVGIARYLQGTWTLYRSELLDGAATALTLDLDGSVLVAATTGLFEFDGANWNHIHGPSLPNITAIEVDHTGRIWAVAGGRSYFFESNDWVYVRPANHLAVDHLGYVWVATLSVYVWRFDGVTWEQFDVSRSWIRTLTSDDSGNIWLGWGESAGLLGGGAVRILPSRLAEEDPPVADFPSGYTSVCAHSNGSVWFATREGRILEYLEGDWISHELDKTLIGSNVTHIVEMSNGNLICGTDVGGFEYDPDTETWDELPPIPGAGKSEILDLLVDDMDRVWVALPRGLGEFEGDAWTVHLAGHAVSTVFQDRDANLWCSTDSSLYVLPNEEEDWRSVSYPSNGRLPVLSIDCEPDGRMWFQDSNATTWSPSNVFSFEPSTEEWVHYDKEMGGRSASSLFVDSHGVVWLGGVGTFGGNIWSAETRVSADHIAEDATGKLWFARWNDNTVFIHEPDRAGPQTLLVSRPPRVSAAYGVSIQVANALPEELGIVHSYQLDGEPVEVSSASAWTTSSLTEGEHLLTVGTVDAMGNVDPTPVRVRFEIDRTPPDASIGHPQSGASVSGYMDLIGTASDPRLQAYTVEARKAPEGPWWKLGSSNQSVDDGVLAGWDTTESPDGVYYVRLTVRDTLGLVATATTRLAVDNHLPHEMYSPASVLRENGGKVFSEDGAANILIPPQGLTSDAVVSLACEGIGEVNDGPAETPTPLAVYSLRITDAQMRQDGVLEVQLQKYSDSLGEATFFVLESDRWRRMGGTVGNGVVRAVVSCPGTYAVFVEKSPSDSDGSLTRLTITPRSLSLSTTGDDSVAIGFTMGQTGPAAIRVYSRSGRLVRRLSDGRHFRAGSNVVTWDGRDQDGSMVTDGLFVVTVEFGGDRRSGTVAVVR